MAGHREQKPASSVAISPMAGAPEQTLRREINRLYSKRRDCNGEYLLQRRCWEATKRNTGHRRDERPGAWGSLLASASSDSEPVSLLPVRHQTGTYFSHRPGSQHRPPLLNTH